MKNAAPSDYSGRDGGESQLSLDFGESFSLSSSFVNSDPVPLSGELRMSLIDAGVTPAALAALEYVTGPAREGCSDSLRYWFSNTEMLISRCRHIILEQPGELPPVPIGADTLKGALRWVFRESGANANTPFILRALCFACPELRPLIELERSDFDSDSPLCNAIFRAGWRPDKWEGGNSWS